VPLRATASEAREPRQPEANGYFEWSRDLAVGVFAVMPLWLLYEGLRLAVTPDERNGAEALVTDALSMLGPRALVVLRVVLALAILVAAWSIHRRRLPWGRVALVSALEGSVYGLMLGPVTGVLTLYVIDGGAFLASGRLAGDLIGSLGAGIFEEAVFRLGVLSLLALALVRATAAFGLGPMPGIVLAIVVSAGLFSLFHHVGPGGEPFRTDVFLFRAMAGILLGGLFVTRGFGVCVYTHAVYDLHYYLTR
jgi:hypothetical protein